MTEEAKESPAQVNILAVLRAVAAAEISLADLDGENSTIIADGIVYTEFDQVEVTEALMAGQKFRWALARVYMSAIVNGEPAGAAR